MTEDSQAIYWKSSAYNNAEVLAHTAASTGTYHLRVHLFTSIPVQFRL
jgi:hypothetical protein